MFRIYLISAVATIGAFCAVSHLWAWLGQKVPTLGSLTTCAHACSLLQGRQSAVERLRVGQSPVLTLAAVRAAAVVQVTALFAYSRLSELPRFIFCCHTVFVLVSSVLLPVLNTTSRFHTRLLQQNTA